MTAEVVARTSLPASFWAKVDRSGECWLWTGATNSRGYACFGVNGKSQLAHRLSYANANGLIPPGMVIDHLRESGICSSVLCVRPDHLEAVTGPENSRRFWRSVTSCHAGHLLTHTPGDRQRRCRPCENTRRKARRALARKATTLRPHSSGDADVARASGAEPGDGGAAFTPGSGAPSSPP